MNDLVKNSLVIDGCLNFFEGEIQNAMRAAQAYMDEYHIEREDLREDDAKPMEMREGQAYGGSANVARSTKGNTMPCNHPKYILRSDRSWYCTSCGEKVPSQTPPANGDMIRLEPGPEVPEKDAYLNAIHRDLREVTEMLYGLCEEVWYLDQEHVVDLPEATKAWYQWHKARKDLAVNKTEVRHTIPAGFSSPFPAGNLP